MPIDSPEENESITDFCKRFFQKHKGQRDFLNSSARYRAAISGIGGGKSLIGAFDLVRHALKYPKSQHMVIAPTYRMLKKSSWQSIKKVLGWWKDLEYKEKIADMQIELPNGSRILSGYAQNPDYLRGVEVSTIWIDEAALCPEELWNIAIGRIRQPNFPHRIWVTTTPRGRNWIYKKFFETEDENYKTITWTTKNNPLYETEPDFINDLVKSYGGESSKWYKQEVLGEFVSFEGLVYDNFDEDIHISKDQPKNPIVTVAGTDWGTSSYGAIVVISLDSDGTVYVLDEVAKKGVVLNWDNQESWVDIGKQLSKTYNISHFFCDPSDPNAINTFNLSGMNAVKANNARIPGIREIQAKFAGNKIKINPNCTNLLSEIKTYEWRKDKNDKILYDLDPVKVNDHSLDALRYAVMGISEVEEEEVEIIDLEDLLGVEVYEKDPWGQ